MSILVEECEREIEDLRSQLVSALFDVKIERDRAIRAEARLTGIRMEASAFRYAERGEVAPVSVMGALFLALVDAEVTS